MSQQLPTTRKRGRRGSRGTGRPIKPWKTQTCPAASNSFTALQVQVSTSSVLPAIPNSVSVHLAPSTEVHLQAPMSTSNVLEPSAIPTSGSERLAPSTEVEVQVWSTSSVLEPPAIPDSVSECIAPSTEVLLKACMSTSSVLEPPATPTITLEHLAISTEILLLQGPESTSSVLEPPAIPTNVSEHLAPSTDIVSKHIAPPAGASECIVPPAGISEHMAPPTGVSELFAPPTPTHPSSFDNLAMLANREATMHFALSRAHSTYAQTLTDAQLPAGISEYMASPTGVSELFAPPTPTRPSSFHNLAMLANREATMHLALSRAHSAYAQTLTDAQ
jgi:hypothetical protein